MSDDPRRQKLAELIDGRLDAAEAERVRLMAAEDPALAAELAELESICELFRAIPEPAVPVGLVGDVMQRVRASAPPAAESQPAPVRRGVLRTWLWGVAGAAAAAVLVALTLRPPGDDEHTANQDEPPASVAAIEADEVDEVERAPEPTASPPLGADAKADRGRAPSEDSGSRTRGGAKDAYDLDAEEVEDLGDDAPPAPRKAAPPVPTAPSTPATGGAEDEEKALFELRSESKKVELADLDDDAPIAIRFGTQAAADRYLTLVRARETLRKSYPVERRRADGAERSSAPTEARAPDRPGSAGPAGDRARRFGAGPAPDPSASRWVESRLDAEELWALARRAGGELVDVTAIGLGGGGMPTPKPGRSRGTFDEVEEQDAEQDAGDGVAESERPASEAAANQSADARPIRRRILLIVRPPAEPPAAESR